MAGLLGILGKAKKFGSKYKDELILGGAIGGGSAVLMDQLIYDPLNKDKYLDGFIEISNIKTNPNQPRKYFDEKSLNELVESIREKGILQAITIKALDGNSFELIAGERRLRAAKILKLKTNIRVPLIGNLNLETNFHFMKIVPTVMMPGRWTSLMRKCSLNLQKVKSGQAMATARFDRD